MLNITVIKAGLPDGLLGLYEPEHARIILHSELSAVQERCVWAHELMHARLHVGACVGLAGKEELRVRRMTALMLIDVAEYASAEVLFGGHVGAIAHELNVTVSVVEDYQKLLEAARCDFK